MNDKHNQLIIRAARMIEREQVLAAKAKRLRDQFREWFGRNNYFSAWGGDGMGNITLQIDLAVYLKLCSDPKPMLCMFRECAEPYSRLHYSPILVGEYAPGKRVWVEAWSDKFGIPAQPHVAPSSEAGAIDDLEVRTAANDTGVEQQVPALFCPPPRV